MKKLILTVGLVIVVAATGVSCDRFKAPYPQLDKSSDAAQVEKSASERRAYAQAAQKELDELRAAIADLKSKAESANQETQGKLVQQVERLEGELREVQQRLVELGSATKETWSQLKDSFAKSVEKLKTEVESHRKNPS